MHIKFPVKDNQHYYEIHYRYLINLFLKANCNIDFVSIPEDSSTSLVCYINDKKVYFDFSDGGCAIKRSRPDGIIFKFHYYYKDIRCQRIFPFCPVSFQDWDHYTFYRQQLYTASGDVVLHAQRAYGNARQRRADVNYQLKAVYESTLDTVITSSEVYYQRALSCLVSVHVPGYCNLMLDRGQLQLMSLGVCTISPMLPEILPWDVELEDKVHYVQCKSDYSDLLEKIEWCRDNRTEIQEIGNKAKKLFNAYCTPKKIVEWMERCVSLNLI